MLSSPLVRRMLLVFGTIGLLFLLVLGLVSLSVPPSEGNALLRGRMLFTASILLVGGLSLLIPMVHRWVMPLEELAAATQQLSEGQYPQTIVTDYDDELGRMAQAFNEMVQSMEARIDELQKKQQRVTSDNEQLATILEAMVEGVIAVDQDEQILLANMAAIRLLHLKRFSIVGRRVWEAIRLPQIHELIRHTLEKEEQHRLEIAVPWTYSTVAVVASRLPGTPCPGVVLVLHDITELRRLENLRRDFVSNVSHELKTPLAAITAYADTLMNGALEDQNVSRTFVGRISEQSDRLNSLILDLLELARIESGEHVFHIDSIDVNEVLRKSADSHHTVAEVKELTIETDLSESALQAQADWEGLLTIVDNLLGNAINYTRPGGKIIIRSRREPPWIVFEVEDNGVGIAKEFQARIFERFFRVDRARSREVGGTGLGLSIVKHLCQLFGGSIKVRSQIGQGSTFTVHLEASDEPLII